MTEAVDVSGDDHQEDRPPRAGRRAAAERALAEFAGGRDGIVTTADLRRFGVGPDAIAHRTRVGRLHRIHQGVYVLGHRALTQRGRWRAAVCACGPGALLSHRSAAALWGLLEDKRSVVDVTVETPRRRRKGIVVHRSAVLDPEDRASRFGIPITAVARTLLDLARVLSEWDLEKAVVEAARLRLLDVAAVERQCGPGRAGSEALRRIVARNLKPAAAARSELELRFLALCRRFKVPAPEVNVRVEGLTVDAFWPDARLIVELDGYAYHRTPGDRRRDAARDRKLALAGHLVLRFGWEEVNADARDTAQTILTLLAERGR